VRRHEVSELLAGVQREDVRRCEAWSGKQRRQARSGRQSRWGRWRRPIALVAAALERTRKEILAQRSAGPGQWLRGDTSRSHRRGGWGWSAWVRLGPFVGLIWASRAKIAASLSARSGVIAIRSAIVSTRCGGLRLLPCSGVGGVDRDFSDMLEAGGP
jgi:hypothetical protein